MNNRQDVHDQVMECPEAMRRDALCSLAAAQDSAGQRALAAAIQAFTQTPAPDWSGHEQRRERGQRHEDDEDRGDDEHIAEVLGIPVSRISVKATTTEG
ncbi:MAG: hypothetical protein R6U42_00130, partial [Halomonas sp.]